MKTSVPTVYEMTIVTWILLSKKQIVITMCLNKQRCLKIKNFLLNQVQSCFLSFKQKLINCRHSNQEVSYFIQQQLAIVFWYVIKFAASMLLFLQSSTSQKERQQYTCRKNVISHPCTLGNFCLLINYWVTKSQILQFLTSYRSYYFQYVMFEIQKGSYFTE